MSYFHFFFYLGIAVVGTIVLLFSRTLNTAEEDKWKGEFWFRELILGPPGYYRATGVIMGVLLIIIGVIGFLGTLLFR
jgi:hypothetical protein